jgi:hypothetical protein
VREQHRSDRGWVVPEPDRDHPAGVAGPPGELAAVVAALGAAVSDHDTRLAAPGPGSA